MASGFLRMSRGCFIKSFSLDIIGRFGVLVGERKKLG